MTLERTGLTSWGQKCGTRRVSPVPRKPNETFIRKLLFPNSYRFHHCQTCRMSQIWQLYLCYFFWRIQVKGYGLTTFRVGIFTCQGHISQVSTGPVSEWVIDGQGDGSMIETLKLHKCILKVQMSIESSIICGMLVIQSI